MILMQVFEFCNVFTLKSILHYKRCIYKQTKTYYYLQVCVCLNAYNIFNYLWICMVCRET